MSLSDPGGVSLFTTNQLISKEKAQDIGELAEKSLWDGFVNATFDGEGFIAEGCFPSKGAGDLDWLVELGAGVVDDPAADNFSTDFQPFFVPAQQSGTLSAHDGVFARIDIITLSALFVDEESSSEKVLSGGSLIPATLDTKRRRSFTLTVTEGTPSGSPAQPSTPSGHILCAVIDVPAISGAITVTDARARAGTKSGALSYRPWRAVPTTLAAKSGNARVITMQAQDMEGNDIGFPAGSEASSLQRMHFVIELTDINGKPANVSSGYQVGAAAVGWTQLSNSANDRIVGKITSSSGEFEVVIDDTLVDALQADMKVTPITYYSDDTTARGPVGYPTLTFVDFT